MACHPLTADDPHGSPPYLRGTGHITSYTQSRPSVLLPPALVRRNPSLHTRFMSFRRSRHRLITVARPEPSMSWILRYLRVRARASAVDPCSLTKTRWYPRAWDPVFHPFAMGLSPRRHHLIRAAAPRVSPFHHRPHPPLIENSARSPYRQKIQALPTCQMRSRSRMSRIRA